jgi:hypothetical protein
VDDRQSRQGLSIHALRAGWLRADPAAAGWNWGKTQIHRIHEGTRTQGLILDYQKHYNWGRRTSAIRADSYEPGVEHKLGERAMRFEDWLGKSLPGRAELSRGCSVRRG